MNVGYAGRSGYCPCADSRAAGPPRIAGPRPVNARLYDKASKPPSRSRILPNLKCIIYRKGLAAWPLLNGICAYTPDQTACAARRLLRRFDNSSATRNASSSDWLALRRGSQAVW